MSKKIIPLIEFRDTLNAVSPTFCTAKWNNTTIYLYNGTTHSCHHPGTHKIPIEGLIENPSNLHNTPVKMTARKELLNGIQTSECNYCWNIENLNNDAFSDRIHKSHNLNRDGDFSRILESGLGENYFPNYVEISFDSTCNMSCTYCLPHISSQVYADIKKFGPISLENFNIDIDPSKIASKSEAEIYRATFWKWWPELYCKLETFRITGGEPLLAKDTWQVLEYLKTHKNPNLTFSLNSNFSLDNKLFGNFITSLNEIKDNVKKLTVFTSLESMDAHAEYARFGLDINIFKRNIREFLLNTDASIDLTFMTTVNILSLPSFDQFIKYTQELREEFPKRKIYVSINYLRWPNFLDISNLDEQTKAFYTEKLSAFLNKLSSFENNCLTNLITFLNKDNTDKLLNRRNFISYHQEYDRRRGTNFQETFPELEDFINFCES